MIIDYSKTLVKKNFLLQILKNIGLDGNNSNTTNNESEKHKLRLKYDNR